MPTCAKTWCWHHSEQLIWKCVFYTHGLDHNYEKVVKFGGDTINTVKSSSSHFAVLNNGLAVKQLGIYEIHFRHGYKGSAVDFLLKKSKNGNTNRLSINLATIYTYIFSVIVFKFHILTTPITECFWTCSPQNGRVISSEWLQNEDLRPKAIKRELIFLRKAPGRKSWTED